MDDDFDEWRGSVFTSRVATTLYKRIDEIKETIAVRSANAPVDDLRALAGEYKGVMWALEQLGKRSEK